MIAGNFNIHIDTDTDADTIRMCDVLDMCDLTQHVTVPTHVSSHTLHVLITGIIVDFLLSSPTADYIVSDHVFVMYTVHLPRSPLETRSGSYRKLKQIDKCL